MVLFQAAGCSASVQSYVEEAFALDTFVSVTYYNKKDRQSVLDALELCRSYEKVFSCTDSESELYKLNEADYMEVSDSLLSVIQTALDFSEKSGGKFDITMGGVSRLYGFSEPAPRVPDAQELQKVLSHTGYGLVTIEGNFVSIADCETVIDLGAIAKGFIADEMQAFLLNQGVKHAIISLGGNILTLGGKPNGEDFKIGIQYPEKDSQQLVSTVRGSDISVVTSGVYERFFEADGRVYHHILDPENGLPAESGLLSVSIVGPVSMVCDALSTVCFTLGADAGMKLMEEFNDYEALFVTQDGEILTSSGFDALKAE